MGNAKTLAYFDNANHVPAPYGVPVPFNQERKDIWLGYDEMTGQLCITNYDRTVIIVCFSGSLLFNSTEDKIVSTNGVQSIRPTVGVGSSSIIPANSLRDGTKLSITLTGTFLVPDGGSFIFPATFLFRLKVGGVVIVNSDAFLVIPADNVLAGFTITLSATFRSAGNLLVAGGNYILNAGNGSFISSSAAIDPSVDNQVDVEKDFGGATITTTIMSITEG